MIFSNLNLWRNVCSFSSLYKNSPVFCCCSSSFVVLYNSLCFFLYRSHRTTIRPMRILYYKMQRIWINAPPIWRLHCYFECIYLFIYFYYSIYDLFWFFPFSCFQFILVFFPFRVFFLHIFVVWFLTSTYISCTWPNKLIFFNKHHQNR